MNILLLVICSSTVTASVIPATDENQFPIIGIMAQGLPPLTQEMYPAYNSFIAASYVKAVESSGARVVPIPVRRNETYYRELLQSLNGVVLPGGTPLWPPNNPYYDAATIIYKIALEMNQKGTAFPILAVCLGFVYLVTIANGHHNFLYNCSIGADNLPLQFVQPYKQTALFKDANEEVYSILSSSDVTVNHHTWCALEKDFVRWSPLKNEWTITSVSTSSAGLTPDLEFIATMEHKEYPFFGVQFHPEKIAFEWNPSFGYPHSREAVIANRYFYDTLVNYARKNKNKFASTKDEKRSLIYNCAVRIPENYFYEQIYLF